MAINRVTYPSTPTPASGDWDLIVDLMQTGYLKMENALRIDYVNDNVLEGAVFHIGGTVFLADSDTAITGTPSDFVKLTVSGATASAAYVADLTGVTWNEAQNGYYDISGNLYVFDEVNSYLKEELSEVNTEPSNILPTLALLGKGYISLDLTNYNTTAAPQIVAGSVVEINGKIYRNNVAVTITGSVSNSTWYDILLTPSGSTYTATYVARETGVWDSAKGGLYSGNNRVVACVYVDGSGNYINKNMLNVVNRKIELKIEIGPWDMDTVRSINFPNPIDLSSYIVTSAYMVIINDAGTSWYAIYGNVNSIPDASINTFTTLFTYFKLQSELNGQFDVASFSSTASSRGWIYFTYEVY
jgi:hypothetical protein